jgi:hypothetical protein
LRFTRKNPSKQRITKYSQPFASVPIGFYPKGSYSSTGFFPKGIRTHMATPLQLVETVSAATGVPLPTVVDMDRRLVKAKLRAKAGRGFNAARMTALDAARLLTAVLASGQSNEAAEAVERYSLTVPDRTRSSEKLFAAAKLDDLAALPLRLSFVDALGALIASAANGSLAAMIAGLAKGSTPSIEVFAFTRAVKGRIRIAGLPDGFTTSIEYIPAAGVTRKPRGRRRGDQDAGDLEQSRRITERTILPVAKLLAKDNSDE